jgi:hypothetical protein
MATLLEKWAMRNSENLRTRLAQIMQDTAYNISNEATDTPNYAARRVWALAILGNKDAAYGEATRVQWRLGLNATVAAAGDASTDADLEFVFLAEILSTLLSEVAP